MRFDVGGKGYVRSSIGIGVGIGVGAQKGENEYCG